MQNLNFYETRERNLCKQLFTSYEDKLHAYQFTKPGSRKGYDGFYQLTPQDSSVVFEVKARDIQIDQYPDYIMEAGKANTLSTWHNQGHQTKYFNFFKKPDGRFDFIGFDITTRIEEWRELGYENVVQLKWMNAVTCVSRKNKIQKEVIMLKFRPDIDTRIEGGHFFNN